MSVRPYLPHALIATVGVLAAPLLVVLGLRALDPAPNLLILLLAGFAATAVAVGIGIALWKTRPESADIAFGELLIWGWLQRKKADDRLDEGVRLLGLDRSGHPTQPVRISPEDQLSVLQDLNDALEAKDPYTHGHSRRVERHAYRTATAMGFAVDMIEELRLAAALHDVGKIRVPDRILRKPARLTAEERAIVEDHVVVGAWMVSNVGSADVVSAVHHHHERWDGRGYPDGLAGTDIPIYARIIAVADAYDAITSTRPYRVSAGREHAVSILRAESGAQFDPMIVNSFIDALPVRLPVAGALVLLAGPAAIGRKLAMWLKRLGGGHLAPAAATLGAIITLGAFMPAPSLAPPKSPTVAAAPESQGSVEPHAKDVDRPAKQETKRTRGPRPALVAEVPSDPTGSSTRVDDVVLGDDLSRGPREPHPVPPKPETEPVTQPASPAPEESDPVEDGEDPCPEEESHKHGNGHEKAKGEGHTKHCE